MKYQIIFSLFVLTLLTTATHALTLRTESKISHQLETTLISRFTHRLSHYGELPQTTLTALTQFVKSDKEMTKNVTDNKPLSKEAAQKVKNFLIQNKDFQNFSIQILTSRATNTDCMKNINDTLRTKLIKLILDEWDITEIFMQKKQELNDPQVHDVVTKLQKQKDIKTELDRCFAKFE